MKFHFLLLSVFLISFNAFGLDPLSESIKLSASAMKAEQERLRIIAQNVANKDSTSSIPSGEPYRRQIAIITNKKNIKTGSNEIQIKKFTEDKSDFKLIYDPNHPAANFEGYVKYPNVNIHIENADSKDAARTYEANLNMIDLSKTMFNKTLDILK